MADNRTRTGITSHFNNIKLDKEIALEMKNNVIIDSEMNKQNKCRNVIFGVNCSY